jgi:two-component system response regulator
VVLSTSDHPEDIAYCYSIGVNSYVHKPTDFDEFLETIRVIEHYWLRVVRPPASSPPFSQDAGCEAG